MGFRDGFGRTHDDLRISVTDRCNLRCGYCMPEEPVWFERETILRFEEIARIAGIAALAGVRKLRLTGGEPLLRRGLPDLVRMLVAIPGIEDISLTTNGLLLRTLARPLAEAGLTRINVSLDTLRRDRFLELTRRDALDHVLAGLAAAAEAGLGPIKINTVLLADRNEDEVEPLVDLARENGWEIRFIEFMPLSNDGGWTPSRVVTGESVRARISRRWALEPVAAGDPHAPARRYRFRDGRGAVGFIDSVSAPFCASCNRLRLTSDGKFMVCLYDEREVDLKTPLRAGASDGDLLASMENAVRRKGRGGALDILERPGARPFTARTMHQIGG